MSVRFSLAATSLVLLAGCDNTAHERPRSIEPEAVFEEISASVGLNFRHFLGATGNYYLPEITGSGVALLDFDQDGDLDVYLVQGAPLDSSVEKAYNSTSIESYTPGNRLFRNELVSSGTLAFADVTEEAGVGNAGFGMGVAVGDYDNDGYPDLYVTNVGPNVLYRNNGRGVFENVTNHAGAQDERWSTSAAFLDFDSDGDLDLFVANYVDFTYEGNKPCYGLAGWRDYCGPQVYRPVPDRLFRNEGNGRFRDVSADAGLGTSFGSGLGVVTADFNGDGWIDMYVANDGNANQLWMNNRDGTFEDQGIFSGAALNAHGRTEAGMGVIAADFDEDGDEDLFVTHLSQETNTLYLNDGKAGFVDATKRFRLGNVSMGLTGFGTYWFDYDNDGRLDLFVANGAVTIIDSLRGADDFPYRQPDQLYRAIEEGYELIAPALAWNTETIEVGRGAAFGDVDNDGDIDFVESNGGGPARLFLNGIGATRDWIQVRVRGTASAREAHCARVALIRSNQALSWRRIHRDGSFLSASEPVAHFGLGDSGGESIEGIGVIWPSGLAEQWKGLRINTKHVLVEGTGQPWNPRDLAAR